MIGRDLVSVLLYQSTAVCGLYSCLWTVQLSVDCTAAYSLSGGPSAHGDAAQISVSTLCRGCPGYVGSCQTCAVRDRASEQFRENRRYSLDPVNLHRNVFLLLSGALFLLDQTTI